MSGAIELDVVLVVLPGATSFSTAKGKISSREVYECDAVAALLSGQPGVRGSVFEGPLGEAPAAAFYLVSGSELDRHRASLPGGSDRLGRIVLANADRDRVLDALETDRFPGALSYLGAADWREPGRGKMFAQRSVVAHAGGTIAPQLPRVWSSENYVLWSHPDFPTLDALLVSYLRLFVDLAPLFAEPA